MGKMFPLRLLKSHLNVKIAREKCWRKPSMAFPHTWKLITQSINQSINQCHAWVEVALGIWSQKLLNKALHQNK